MCFLPCSPSAFPLGQTSQRLPLLPLTAVSPLLSPLNLTSLCVLYAADGTATFAVPSISTCPAQPCSGQPSLVQCTTRKAAHAQHCPYSIMARADMFWLERREQVLWYSPSGPRHGSKCPLGMWLMKVAGTRSSQVAQGWRRDCTGALFWGRKV